MSNCASINTPINYESMTDDEILVHNQKGADVLMARLRDRVVKIEEENRLRDKATEENRKDIDNLKVALDERTNRLGCKEHRSRRTELHNICKARYVNLLGKNSAEYVLFEPYFRGGIYSQIALQVTDHESKSCDDISMEDWKNPNSPFQKAKELGMSWRPSRKYFDYCYNDLKDKARKGYLSDIRLRALENFKMATKDGENVYFLS